MHKFADERDKREMHSNNMCLDLTIYIAPTRRSVFICASPGARVTQCGVIAITASILRGTGRGGEGEGFVPGEKKRMEGIGATDVIARINLNMI